MNFDIKVIGMVDLTRKLHTLPSVIRNRIRQAQRQTSSHIVRIAKKLVPVDTGFLKSTIHGQWSPHNPLIRQVVADARYAVFVEFGRHIYNQLDAQPFLRPAMLQVDVKYFQDVGIGVMAAIVEVANGGGTLNAGSTSDDKSSSNRGDSKSHSGSSRGSSGSSGGNSRSSSRYSISAGGGGKTLKIKNTIVGINRVTALPKHFGNEDVLTGLPNNLKRTKKK